MAFAVAAGVSALGALAQQAGTSWKDRLRQAAVVSPSGTRIKFDYEDVSREVTLGGTVFEFPGVDGAYVQRKGFGARRYPLRCFFWGKDCDRIATAFESALLEPGLFKLEHPLHGPVTVVPLGDVVRRDDLKSAANQSVVEVTFWTTTGAVYPSAQTNAENEIAAALGNFNVQQAQQFADSVDVSKVPSAASLKSTIRKFLRNVSAELQTVADKTTEVNREFRETQALINEGLDVLVGQPLQLALQISNLVTAPARAIVGLQSRLDAYKALAAKIFGSAAADPAGAISVGTALALRLTRILNDFHASDLLILSSVSGSIAAALNTDFATRGDALAAAADILGQFDAAIAWRDGGFDAVGGVSAIQIGQLDTGEAYQALHDAAARTAGLLIQSSFKLIPERVKVLDRDRTILDLSAELYGSVDDRLDFLIDTNDLTGDEILELKTGRKVRYYVQ